MLMRSPRAPQPRYLLLTMPDFLTRWLASSWLEPVLLRRAWQRSRALDDAARARMKAWVEAARGRLRVARGLVAPEDQSSALALLRDATGFASRAVLLADPERVAHAEPASGIAECLDAVAKAEDAPTELDSVRAAFSQADPLALEALSTPEYEALRLSVERVLQWLLSLAELRTPSQLVRARWLRVSAAVLGALLVLAGLVSYWMALSALEP